MGRGYYVKPVTTLLSLFWASSGFVTTTTHYALFVFNPGLLERLGPKLKTTTLEINAGIPVTLIAERKFQGSGNLTEKYFINHKKSRDHPNAHSRS